MFRRRFAPQPALRLSPDTHEHPMLILNADQVRQTLSMTSADPVFSASAIRPGTHINAVGSYQPHTYEDAPIVYDRGAGALRRHLRWIEAEELTTLA